MKKLVMLSVESVFSGRVLSGMAEMVDSMANALSRDYEVTIVCPDGDSIFARTASNLRVIEDGIRTCRFSAVDYYLIKQDMWLEKVVDLVEKLNPDILHNFAEPEILGMLKTRPKKAICTFDQADFVRGKDEYLRLYDAVTTSSENYAREVLRANDKLANTLSSIDFRGITAGILDVAFAPEKGLLIPNKYTADSQEGKQLCKQRLLKTYGIDGNPYICLMMCRLVKEKGLEKVFDVIDTIRETGGLLVVVGKGKHKYEQQLRKYRRSDGVVYIDRWASPVQAAPLAAGADFYLCPSNTEACGLMPMTASRYGAIPIVTLNGGLADNFNDNNAIVIDENGLSEAIKKAAAIYADNELMTSKRKVCMEQDFSWTTRKAGYIELYEKE
jgi:glycosyltransferase involved in cell wall biosynthesis